MQRKKAASNSVNQGIRANSKGVPQPPGNQPQQYNVVQQNVPQSSGQAQHNKMQSKSVPVSAKKPDDRVLLQLNNAVLDHLEQAGYNKVAKILREEIERGPSGSQERVKQGVQSARGQKKDVQPQQNPHALLLLIQQNFDKGNKNEFFKAFDSLVPIDMKKKDYSYKKLEFFLQIYFVVYIRHPNIHPKNITQEAQEKELADAQSEFKKYLDSKGSELSKANEFLAYYALPYIPNPSSHPSFKHLYTVEWVQDLKQKLKSFIQNNSQKLGLIQPGVSSKLYGIFKDFSQIMSSEKNASVESETLSDRLKLMQKNMVILQKKEAYSKKMLYESQLKWTNFSYDVVRNCKELIMAMEQAGLTEYQLFENQNVRHLENIKIRIHKYDMFLKNNSKELNAKGYGINQPIQQQQQQQPYYHQPQMSHPQQQNSGPQPSFFSEESNNDFLLQMSNIPQSNQNRDQTLNSNQPIQGHNYFSGSANVQPQINSQRAPINIQSQQYQLDKNDVTEPNQQPPMGIVMAPLDYNKIKDFLKKSAKNPHHEVEVCATLQALSWRITKVSSQIRRQNLHSYQHFDILELKKQESNSIFHQLISDSGSMRVKEFFIIFINAFASEYLGRCYLLQRKDIVKVLINILFSQKEDTSLRQNALGALQKFSLRRDAQSIMIHLDVILWIIQTLKTEYETLSDYSLEYTTALLMNLSLRVQGKNKCEEMPQNIVLQVLSELIEHDNMVVRTHVNGTLYSILTRKALKQQARSLGMQEMLFYLMENSDEQLKKQIQYILNQLNTEEAKDGETDAEDDNEEEDYDDDYGDEDVGEDGEDDEDEEEPFENEADIMDEDLDKLHDQMKERGNPIGEEWLTSQFLLPNEEAFSQTMTISKKMESAKEEKLNASAISYSRSRPLSPFAADNAFNLSKAGYANPGNLDRANPSAMKQKRNNSIYGKPEIGQMQTQNVVSNGDNAIDFGKYNQLNHDMLFNIQSTQQPQVNNIPGLSQETSNLGQPQYQPQIMNKQNLVQGSQFDSQYSYNDGQYQTYNSKNMVGGRKQQPHQSNPQPPAEVPPNSSAIAFMPRDKIPRTPSGRDD